LSSPLRIGKHQCTFSCPPLSTYSTIGSYSYSYRTFLRDFDTLFAPLTCRRFLTEFSREFLIESCQINSRKLRHNGTYLQYRIIYSVSHDQPKNSHRSSTNCVKTDPNHASISTIGKNYATHLLRRIYITSLPRKEFTELTKLPTKPRPSYGIRVRQVLSLFSVTPTLFPRTRGTILILCHICPTHTIGTQFDYHPGSFPT